MLCLVALLKECSAKFCPEVAALLRFRFTHCFLSIFRLVDESRKSGDLMKKMAFIVLLPIIIRLVNINILLLYYSRGCFKNGFLKMAIFFKYFTPV
jgi:hypothetical protein